MSDGENLNKVRHEESDFELKAFLLRYLRFWYVYVACIALGLVIARYYNWYRNPVYAITAKLMVRDDNMGKEKFLQQLDVDKPVKNIENEIEILRSYNLLFKALNKLEFDVSYFLVGDVKVSEVYKDCPFSLQSDQVQYGVYNKVFDVHLVDSSRFEWSYASADTQVSYTEQYGVPFDMGLGTITLHKRDIFPELALTDPAYEKRKYQVKFNTIGYNQNKYLSKLSIGMARPQSTILQLYIEDEVPQKGLDFLNKLIEVYFENDIETKNSTAAATGTFLDEQLKSITDDLVQIETNREKYKVSKGIIDLESESQLVLDNIRTVDAEKSINSARLGMIDQLESYITDNQDVRDLAPAALDISDPLLVKLINKLSELQSQREIVINRSTSNDPELMPLNAEIDLTRASLLENIRNIRKGLIRKQSELDQAITDYRNRIERIPTTERELLEIERRFRIQESLYLFLLQKRAELSISLAATESDTRLIDSARLMPGPISPIPQRAYSIAIILSILLPTLVIFGLDKLNDKVNDTSVLSKLTRIPLLGVVRYNPHQSALVAIAKPQSAIAEEYRSIRTNLDFFNADKRVKVVMVTSSVGTEGKTFTAMNLASVIAASGLKTVLIGLDLRKPRIVDDFEIDNSVGCSNYLSGNADIDSVIMPSGAIPNLSIIPSGPIPPNPSELIMSERMKEMMAALSQRFDKIIIDTPPVGLVSDGLILSEMADAIIFVVRDGVTRKAHIRQAEALYEKGQLRHVGLIFNAARRRNKGYGHAGGYGYTYGGNYGNYFEDEQSQTWLKKVLNRFGRNG
jgi:capsular exopolysaccharide synthesis family protein